LNGLHENISNILVGVIRDKCGYPDAIGKGIQMTNGYYESMRAQGFSYNTTASVRKFDCPFCGFRFSLVYARTFACQGCSEAAKGCPKVRCNECDNEFPIGEFPDIQNEAQQRSIADHICKIVSERNSDLGVKANR